MELPYLYEKLNAFPSETLLVIEKDRIEISTGNKVVIVGRIAESAGTSTGISEFTLATGRHGWSSVVEVEEEEKNYATIGRSLAVAVKL